MKSFLARFRGTNVRDISWTQRAPERDIAPMISRRTLRQYSKLFFLLHSDPLLVARLCQLFSFLELDKLLPIIMFSLYGTAGAEHGNTETLVLTMLRSALSSHVEAATDIDSILCPNAAVSHMLEWYTRRKAAQDYVAALLGERIYRLLKYDGLNLEVLPTRVYQQLVDATQAASGAVPVDLPINVTPEVAAANENVQAIIGPRMKMLGEILDGVISHIINEVDSVPYGIRWICKRLRIMVLQKFPDATDESISSVVGGFFFVCFLCPIIQTPEAYLPVDIVIAKYPRRTLSSISMMLHSYGNRPLDVGQKVHMAMLQLLAEKHRASVHKFLNDLCDVEETPYTSTAERIDSDASLSIHLNDLFVTHSLILSKRDVLASETDDPLRILLEELEPVPPRVPVEENLAIQLLLNADLSSPGQGVELR